jgi:hypothetical protein
VSARWTVRPDTDIVRARRSPMCQSEMTILRIVISLWVLWWSMIFSENRYTLFGIML